MCESVWIRGLITCLVKANYYFGEAVSYNYCPYIIVQNVSQVPWGFKTVSVSHWVFSYLLPVLGNIFKHRESTDEGYILYLRGIYGATLTDTMFVVLAAGCPANPPGSPYRLARPTSPNTETVAQTGGTSHKHLKCLRVQWDHVQRLFTIYV